MSVVLATIERWTTNITSGLRTLSRSWIRTSAIRTWLANRRTFSEPAIESSRAGTRCCPIGFRSMRSVNGSTSCSKPKAGPRQPRKQTSLFSIRITRRSCGPKNPFSPQAWQRRSAVSGRLTVDAIVEAYEDAATFRRGMKIREGTLRHHLAPSVFFGLLGESHVWKTADVPKDKIKTIVDEFDREKVETPREGWT
jgi:hypothetical protein